MKQHGFKCIDGGEVTEIKIPKWFDVKGLEALLNLDDSDEDDTQMKTKE